MSVLNSLLLLNFKWLVFILGSGAGGAMFSQEGLEWRYLCSFKVMEHGHPSSTRLLPSNLLVIGNINGKITIWRLRDPRPGLARHEAS